VRGTDVQQAQKNVPALKRCRITILKKRDHDRRIAEDEARQVAEDEGGARGLGFG